MSGKRLVPHLSGQTDSISRKPIVTTKDFIFLRLETDYSGKYTINGQISKYKMNKWVKETERATGRQIAFVFNDSIIARPRVNCRIENGVFQITSISDKKIAGHIQRTETGKNWFHWSSFQGLGKGFPLLYHVPGMQRLHKKEWRPIIGKSLHG